MALTPEDVVNKRFQPTKFREGYDQDEVDDFLDEVVVELRRLGLENEDLRQQLAAAGSQPGSQQAASQQAASQQFGSQQFGSQHSADAQFGGMAATESAPAAAPAPAFVPEPVAEPAAGLGGSFAGSDASVDPNNTNNLLLLARRLHEEHVREGIEKRDSLIAEGHATAARIVSEAEQQQRAEIDSLDQERQTLEGRIDDLREFEREYRAKLKGHIEGLLHDLDGTAGPVGDAPVEVGAQPASHPAAMDQEPANFGGVPSQPQTGFPGFGGN